VLEEKDLKFASEEPEEGIGAGAGAGFWYSWRWCHSSKKKAKKFIVASSWPIVHPSDSYSVYIY